MWKSINGYEGNYEVSDTGAVRSVDRIITDSRGASYFRKGKSMKITASKGRNGNGYFVVNLRKNNSSFVACVHVLVATEFIPNPNGLPTVNHKDGNKRNNDVTNLEWSSYRDNNIHAITNNLRKPRGNKIIQYDFNGNMIGEYSSMCDAFRKTGISVGSISHCLNHRTHTAGGYIWIRDQKVQRLSEKSRADNGTVRSASHPETDEDIV